MPRNVEIPDADDATGATPGRPTMADWLARADRWRAEHGGVSRADLAAALDDARGDGIVSGTDIGPR